MYGKDWLQAKTENNIESVDSRVTKRMVLTNRPILHSILSPCILHSPLNILPKWYIQSFRLPV